MLPFSPIVSQSCVSLFCSLLQSSSKYKLIRSQCKHIKYKNIRSCLHLEKCKLIISQCIHIEYKSKFMISSLLTLNKYKFMISQCIHMEYENV
ncbi:hypothetical protein OUZ56_026222 [Daphnia magna]|uniref:Uncharacterized protein n=1 Tax=Daphnia magna TaxID=35525 RepID=A0ABQ9ZL41_9CRUS|nr:hypothetical protein OUZ56_026222 [Daphnia magna]